MTRASKDIGSGDGAPSSETPASGRSSVVTRLRPAIFGLSLTRPLACTVSEAPTSGPRSAPQPPRISFRRQVAPILVKRCLACHDDRKASGGLSMATFAALERGGKERGRSDPGAGRPGVAAT